MLFIEKLRMCQGNWILAIVRYNGQGPMAKKYLEKVLMTVREIDKYEVL